MLEKDMLLQFYRELTDWLDRIAAAHFVSYDALQKYFIPEGIQKRIHGLGFALTCDWLKECGCTWLAKPDIHINKIVSRIREKDSVPHKEVVRFLFDWAKLVREEGVDEDATAYKLDKMLWLVCTENFYLDFQGNNRDRICQRVDTLLHTEG